MRRRRWHGIIARSIGTAGLILGGHGLSGQAIAAAAPQASEIRPLVAGDEPIVVTRHSIRTHGGPLDYEVRAGRIPIRTDRSGEIRGHIFFTAYIVRRDGPPRPITFAWNGGPLISSAIVHMEGLAPRRREGTAMVDNPDTVLTETDLVFMDPIETGFSRPARPEFAADFMSMLGDVNATAEFIRAYRARFHTAGQPTFLLGESYGVFRAAAVADLLTERGSALAGAVLISGDIPNIPQSPAFYDAMHVPARTATAYHYRRLDSALMHDRAATLREAAAWSRTVYLPALERADSLDDAERETIAAALARYTAFPLARIDRRTLVVHASDYLRFALADDGSEPLSDIDTRIGEDAPGNNLGDPLLVDRYIRGELGYATDLTYAGLEKGYAPFPGPRLPTIGDRWEYNQPGVTPAVIGEMRQTGEVSPLARANPPWIVNALKRNADLRVFVATGRFDPLNMCEGDVLATGTLPAALSARITNRCYESGHIIFREDDARTAFLADLRRFFAETARAP